MFSLFPLCTYLYRLQCLYTTRFQLILPLPNHDVTKNLTDHRMHVEGPQIFQINRQINSFQNMHVEVFNQAACFEWKTHISALVSSKTFYFYPDIDESKY